MKKVIKVRAVLSSLILIAFVIVLFSGVGLYFSPSGRIAREISWNFLGFNRWELEDLHIIFGFIMSRLVIVHLIMNYKLFFCEIKTLFKK